MTDRPAAGRAATTRRRSALAVGWSTVAIFLAVLTGLALQLRSGHDPALGADTSAAPATTAPRQVLVRRIVEKRVVVHVVPATSQPGSPPAPTPAPAPAPSVVVTSSPPAPAPAPAPVTTRAS
jgi:hypothetical protein